MGPVERFKKTIFRTTGTNATKQQVQEFREQLVSRQNRSSGDKDKTVKTRGYHGARR